MWDLGCPDVNVHKLPSPLTISLAGSKREYLLAFPITWCGRCRRTKWDVKRLPAHTLALTLPRTPERDPRGNSKEAMSSGEAR